MYMKDSVSYIYSTRLLDLRGSESFYLCHQSFIRLNQVVVKFCLACRHQLKNALNNIDVIGAINKMNVSLSLLMR